MQHAEQPLAEHEWHPEHALDALLPQDRIGDRGLVYPPEPDGLAAGGDPPSETHTDRNSDALPHLFFQPTRRTCDEIVCALCMQEHGSGVRIEDSAEPFEHLEQELVDVQPGESGISDSQQVRQPR